MEKQLQQLMNVFSKKEIKMIEILYMMLFVSLLGSIASFTGKKY